jgi:hypothetical protein
MGYPKVKKTFWVALFYRLNNKKIFFYFYFFCFFRYYFYLCAEINNSQNDMYESAK